MTPAENILLIAENGEEFPINIAKFTEEQSFLFSELIQTSLSSEISLQLPHSFDVVSNLVFFTEIGKVILVSINDAMDMYETSKIYEIKAARDLCQKFLIEHITALNVCRIYEFSCKHKDDLLQFHCWKMFDSSWNDVFSGDDWLKCSEETVLRYVTRPIYESLRERDLFRAVYVWCKMKIGQTLQQSSSSQTTVEKIKIGKEIRHIMELFFPFIRFLAMEWEYLETFVFNLYLLTDEEMNGIREYHRTKETVDLPTSICKTKVERRPNDDICLYEYTKKYNLDFKINKSLKKHHEFFCEILVHEDCFVTEINLPIKLIPINHQKLNMKIEGRNITCGENLPEQFGVFNEKEKIELVKPLLLRKEMQYQFHVKIADEKEPVGQIRKEALCFMSQLQHDQLPKRKKYYKDWRHFYLITTLYF